MRCPRCAAVGVAICVCAFVAATWPKAGDEGDLHLPTFSTAVSGATATTSLTNSLVLAQIPPDQVVFNTVADGEYEAKPVPRPTSATGSSGTSAHDVHEH